MLLVLGVAGYGYAEATRAPVVRRATFTLPDLPPGTAPIRILLMADMHAQGPDMPTARLERIVGQANALHPDIIVLAGDFIGNNVVATRRYDEAAAIAPLAGLRAKEGVFAVLGNNDRPDGAAAMAALRAAGINVLEKRAVQLGPIVLGGLRTRFGSTVRRILARSGARIVISHSPDGFASLPPGIDLMLAGHTHCGQIVLPLVGPLATGSEFGSRYLCGVTVENGRALVVTGGLGTSQVPFRIGAPPDMWLIELRPRPPQALPTLVRRG
ncbi:metallophosphoesterase [Sphingomonas sp.]|uniref:metallophosphoesterase n=1 Tax=Sphingomonas sp. TaxID=28214 RepID=UPI0025CDB8E4|nr:metallophosphoesterase [Sphingomonas sp.]MBV9528923.1 metallophosphoesterase [Sphingomonas sp.]